ncbi:MAG: TonB-dependent receptor [Acidobacteria bacterium]|nr:TonB-dependent receptor [Acidobacteriota bacterium]
MRLLYAFALLVAGAGILFAQAGTDGSILGIVRDTTGAAIPGAQVLVTNLDTGVSRSAATGANGSFEVPALPRGYYSIRVSAPQFAPWELLRVELTVGELKRVSPVLKVGEVKETVTVEAAVELMQTEKASLETVIEEKQIRDLPLNNRNPIQMVNLVPGMRFQGVAGLSREYTVQGNGIRNDQTSFTIDGLDSNDPSNEKGIAIPNLDTIAQFSVQTSNFGAEQGRNPMQVMMVTKSGTNEFHGTLWEFHRNAALDARNTFAQDKPKLIRNQFGFTLGAPVIRNRTFFFGSYEGTRIREERIYNSPTVAPEMLEGDFSSLPRAITDPLTGQPFANNRIPRDRISAASRFFFPQLVLPNSPGNRFRAVAPSRQGLDDSVLRIDHHFSEAHRSYIRWIRVSNDMETPQYRPDVLRFQDLTQHNVGFNHNWMMSPATLFTLALGYLQSQTNVNSPAVGKENLVEQAGIQGFATAGREEAIGFPNVAITGYTGFSLPSQVPGWFKREDLHGKTGMNLIRQKHSIGFGYEYNDRRSWASHASASPRGTFRFNSQYTGDGFADYLLGLLQSDERNFPIKAFGLGHSPYSAFHVQDYWRVHPQVTLTLGVRYDRWHEKTLVRNNGATYDPERRKVVADVDGNGRVDLSAQPGAPFLAESTRDLWIPASEAGIPRGLFEATGYWSPRLGATWRPFAKRDVVFRAGYGIFTSSYNGNISASQIIGPPYWTFERQTFARPSRQRWETAFPADPRAFINPSVAAAHYSVDPMKIHEFNASLQMPLPRVDSAITLSYVGSRGRDLITRQDYNEVPAGRYTNLQAAKPFPRLGTVRLYENIGRSWYNALHVKMERRFIKGFQYTFAYAFARNIDEFGASVADSPVPFAPEGYNRGRSELENRHVLTASAIWEMPFGRGRAFLSGAPVLVNAILGGWQLSGIYSFTSGDPLTFTVPGATLGNGFSTRPHVIGDPRLDNPTRELWFNPAAFAAPERYQFGNSGIGLLEGPGSHILNTALMKNFYIGESRYFQLRWELFNAPNVVNLNNPNTTLNQQTTGKILGAGDAREMQLGLKLVF